MIKQLVRALINRSAAAAGYDVPAIFAVDVPPKREWGDFSTNIALMIGQTRPEYIARNVADEIVLKLREIDEIARAEIAGPGFINITLKDRIYFEELAKIVKEGESYGKSDIGKGTKVNVEYVSANPTGPLHIGNARGGPIGESIAKLFKFLGYEVEEEFYVNDIGGQIDKLAQSLLYHYEVKADARIQFPEGGYPGEYIKEISEEVQEEKASELEVIKKREDLLKFFEKEGLAILVRKLKDDCALLGINFNRWSYQSDIEYSGRADEVVEELEEKRATVKKEGALWFKSPEDPDLADRESVLRKSDEKKTLTYFADDIAYHKEKFDRGNKILVNVWGANHHGHVPRMKAAMNAIGYPGDALHIILYQYVRLKNAGEVFRMAKREGNFVTLREVIEAGVAPDAFKYFILSQNPNTPFDFDIQLAKDTSEKNPVYYIKYAHARICSILAKSQMDDRPTDKQTTDESHEGSKLELALGEVDFSLLNNEKEQALYKEVVKFPELVQEIHDDFQMQALPHFAYKIAGLFHDFYQSCQVLTEDKELTRSRLSLILATKHVLANALSILGIEAPEKM